VLRRLALVVAFAVALGACGAHLMTMNGKPVLVVPIPEAPLMQPDGGR